MKIAKNPAIDPTLPKVELILDGEPYYLCFNFGAFALAQAHFRKIGIECNLLHALDLSNMDATQLVPLLYAALITFKPGIPFEKVASLVTFRNIGSIFEGIAKAYAASLADPEDKPSDPPQPEG